MKSTATVLQWLVRIDGTIMILLGLLFWTGNALVLVPVHMLLGIILVLALLVLAVMGAVAGVPFPLVALAIAWAVFVPILGVTQTRLLPGQWHWLIQVLHLFLGLGAIGQADAMARRIKRGWKPAVQF